MPERRSSSSRRNSEDGYILIAVLFLVALIVLSLAVAAPKVAQEIRRDKELEFYHRGEQYARAIRLYYRKTGNYPTDLTQLENTNNLRYLRKRYTDPITGQPFRLIHQGEAKSTLAGLFGQPIAGQIPGASPLGTPIGSSPTGSMTQNGSPFGNNSFGNNGSGLQTTSPGGDSGNTGTGGTGTNTTDPSGSAGTPGTGTVFGSTGAAGSTTPGGRIVGVSSTSPKESIRVYKKQTHYNQWEFVYDPAFEGIAGGGQPGLNTLGTTPGSTPGIVPPQQPQITPAPTQ